MKRIFLLEDQIILRDEIKSSLKNHTEIILTGDAGCTNEDIDRLSILEIDLLIIGIHLDGNCSIDIVKYVKNKFPHIPILVLAATDDVHTFVELMNFGISGYLLKKSPIEELLYAIKKVARNEGYICSELGFSILNRIRGNCASIPGFNNLVNISRRELEVLKLIAEGLTNQEIAEKTFTSKRTVEAHRKNLLDKTGARNTAALIMYSATKGIIFPAMY